MKQTKDIKLKTSGSIMDIFDNHVKSAYNLTDQEYDYICEHATDEELDVLVTSVPTFAIRRKMIEIRNKYLNLMKMTSFRVGSRVRLKKEYDFSGSNRVDWKSGVIVKILDEHIMPEVWIDTEEGYKITEYSDYLELDGNL